MTKINQSPEHLHKGDAKLHMFEPNFKNTLDNLLEGCMIIGFDWTYLYLNETAAQHAQNKREALLGKSMLEMYHGVEQTAIFARYRRCMEERIPQRFEESFTFANGETCWYAINVDPISEGIFVLSLDITASKHADGLIAIYKQIVSTTREGYLMMHRDGIVIDANQAYADMTGYQIGDLLNMPLSQLSLKNNEEQIEALLEKVTALGHDFFESRHRHRDGHGIDVEVSAHYMPEQKVFVGFFREITERKLLQHKLEASLEFSKSLIAGMHDGVVVLNKERQIQDVNAAQCLITGFSREELIGSKAPFPYWQPEEHENTLMIFKKALTDSAGAHEVTFMRKNGERFPAIVSEAEIRNNSGDIISYVRTIKDISAIRAAEAALQTDRRDINRDVLVREVHHRIKNNLQGITGILRLKAAKHPEIKNSIQQAISQVQSVAVIHGLKGRTGKSQVRLCELTIAIAEEIEKTWGDSITVDIPPNWNPYLVEEAEAVPLALILNELMANALKHGIGGVACIFIRRGTGPGNVIWTLQNAGKISQGFDLKALKFLGTGLQLVASLLPQNGVILSWEQHQHQVHTIMDIDAPVIQREIRE